MSCHVLMRNIVKVVRDLFELFLISLLKPGAVVINQRSQHGKFVPELSGTSNLILRLIRLRLAPIFNISTYNDALAI